MQYGQILNKTWDEHVLFAVLLELTYRCNLDCFYCYNDVSAQGRRMDLEEYLRLLDELVAMQTMNLTFTGGEPLACPFFFELGRTARDLGFVTRVKSNGHALNLDLSRRLKQEVDPFNVDVSLHGASAESHDRQTRVTGSFDRLMTNLESMQEAGLRVKLSATLTSWNEDEFEEMFELADQLGLPLNFDTQVTPRDDGSLKPLDIAPSAAAVKKLLQRGTKVDHDRSGTNPESNQSPEASTSENTRYHCGAGAASVTVDPFGNVLPCVQWRRPVGNLHESSMRHIWEHSKPLREVRRITRDVKDVMAAQGPAGKRAGFCPALAEQLSGSPAEIDRGTLYRIQVINNIERKRAEPGDPEETSQS